MADGSRPGRPKVLLELTDLEREQLDLVSELRVCRYVIFCR